MRKQAVAAPMPLGCSAWGARTRKHRPPLHAQPSPVAASNTFEASSCAEEEWEREDHVQALVGALNQQHQSVEAGTQLVLKQAAALPDGEAAMSECQRVNCGNDGAAARYHGIVKWFRGSYGWIVCKDVAKKYRGSDVFLHKFDCDSVPKLGDPVSFRFTLDDKGNPKAVEARIVKQSGGTAT